MLKTGTTLPGLRERRGDYEDWIVDGLGVAWSRVDVVSVYEGAEPPAPEAPAGVIVTGSSAMVSERLDWSERTGAWLVEVVRAGTPLLGICYGHQLLAQALGGRVGPNPRGREMGTVEVRLDDDARDDPLLGGVPERSPFHATHVESVLALPAGARRLAETALDPYAAFAVPREAGAPIRAWGVQFHPEFDAEVMRAYLAQRREILADYGGTILNAFREVETALANERLLAQEETWRRDAAVQAEAARRLSEDRYNRGLEDVITLLAAQRRELETKSTLLLVGRQRLDTRVDLMRALGGGYEAPTAEPRP